MKVKDCMCNKVIVTNQNTSVLDVAKLMKNNKIGCVPICDDKNNMLGIITDRDIVLRTVACEKDLKTTPVSEIMTKNICYCNQEDDIYDAECLMSQNQVRRIPVLEKNKIIGILTLGDLAHNNKVIGKQEVCNTISNICENSCQSKNKY